MSLDIPFDKWLQLLGIVGGLMSFIWSVWVWRDKSNKDLEARNIEAIRLAEARRLESTKPFLEKQLKLYTETSEAAAKIAAYNSPEDIKQATIRLWELYWGELTLVENYQVMEAMVALKRKIESDAPRTDVQGAVLGLTNAMRQSLDASWGIRAWGNPDAAANAAANEIVVKTTPQSVNI